MTAVLPRFKANSVSGIRERIAAPSVRMNTGGRTLLAPRQILKGLWDESGEDVYQVSYRARAADSNAWPLARLASLAF